MSEQDSQQSASLPYGDKPSLSEMAIQATEEVIKAIYRRRKKKMPQGAKLRALAEKHMANSIKDGCDDHVGTAAPRQ
ncbi:MAG TPA: hypothetical protein VN665_01030 [Candidatus Paceibacterota bacterium]|nr:hypothetical protein [Candidatus Paceibacterota bacterium]